MSQGVLKRMNDAKDSNVKGLAVLIDPDFSEYSHLERLVLLSQNSLISYFFIGGSMIAQPNALERTVKFIKAHSTIPVILFPGSHHHFCPEADAILFLSLISGRNPDFLIGNHVLAAPAIKSSGIEVLPTGYLLIDGGKPTTASYISNTSPLPSNKPSIAACTAMAGEMLGMKLIFLDAGSGASQSVSEQMISEVKKVVNVPLIVGGGIKSIADAKAKYNAGADILVVGNIIEENPDFIKEMMTIF